MAARSRSMSDEHRQRRTRYGSVTSAGSATDSLEHDLAEIAKSCRYAKTMINLNSI